MKGLISYDLVMKDDMDFAEGTYRLDSGEWRVFIFIKWNGGQPRWTPSRWDSGVTGVVIRVPMATQLNVQTVEALMSQSLGVDGWERVRGPDSMVLR